MLLSPYEREKLKAFAGLNSDARREDFIQFNPEIKSAKFAIEALMMAQAGWQKKEIPFAWMYAVAAFSLGGEIQDHLLGAEAAKIAAITAPLTGNAPHERLFRASSEALRVEAATRSPQSSEFTAASLRETLRAVRSRYPDVDAGVDELTSSARKLSHSVNDVALSLYSNEPAILMLTMLLLGIMSLANVREVKNSVEGVYRVLALFTNNVFSVENTAQLMLCLIDANPETQDMKRQFMSRFGISSEQEYNAIAIKWIIKELCN